MDMIEWHCPNCDEVNTDIPDRGTHCAYCGQIVWVGNEDDMVFDRHDYVKDGTHPYKGKVNYEDIRSDND